LRGLPILVGARFGRSAGVGRRARDELVTFGDQDASLEDNRRTMYGPSRGDGRQQFPRRRHVSESK
jgi:hypothetical protein